MFNNETVISGGAVSLSLPDSSASFKPLKAVAKATLALACSISMFVPTLSSAAVTKRVQGASYNDYAMASELEDGTQLLFISKPAANTTVVPETASGLDMLFPNARSSNEYEQQIVAELINDFFE